MNNQISRLKKIIFWILSPFLVVIIVLIIAEGGVRILKLAPQINTYAHYISDPYLPYRPKPLSKIENRNDEFTDIYQYNSEGFRDYEHDYKKPDGVFRILGIGDSFTHGAGAPFEKTYLYRLEKMLNKNNNIPKIEIINAGIPGFFPESERLLLKHYGVKYSPDVILVGFLPNDIIDTAFGIDFVKANNLGYLSSKIARQYGDFETLLYLRSHLVQTLWGRRIIRKIKKKYPIKWEDVYIKGGFHEKEWQKVEYEYLKMIKIANKIKAKMIIVHIPQRGPWNKSKEYPAERLANFCKKNGIGFIDVLPAMKSASQLNNNLYWEKDGHCNEHGYEVIAKAIYSELIKNYCITDLL